MPITSPKVPEGLPELMRGLAKSVIKENPENIYVHAAEYFESLIRERDGELDRGYKNFSAYKVYSDYKDKCRGRGGGNDGGSLSAGSVGDIPSSAGGMALRSGAASAGDGDDDSGGSAAATRGRRKKRVRKQGSKDSNKSMDKHESVNGATEPPVGDEEKISSESGKSSKQESLDAIKESSPDLIEQAVVKAQEHQEYQIPSEAKSIVKTVSIDSVTAANTVFSVLQETVVEPDEADREVGEAIETQVEADLAEQAQQPTNCEDVDSYPPENDDDALHPSNDGDFGSTPSTAEVTGEIIEEAEVLAESYPQMAEPFSSEQNVDASDEVDLANVDSLKEKEEPVINGSLSRSESPKNISVDDQHSSEEQPKGVDTVDADNPEPEASVPELPDVLTEEPGADSAKTEDVPEESNEKAPSKDETEEVAADNEINPSVEEAIEEISSIEKTTDEPEQKAAKAKDEEFQEAIESDNITVDNGASEDGIINTDDNMLSRSEALSNEEAADSTHVENDDNAAINSQGNDSKPTPTKEPALEDTTPFGDADNQDQESKLPESDQSEDKAEINEHPNATVELTEGPSPPMEMESAGADVGAESVEENDVSNLATASNENQTPLEDNPNESPKKQQSTEEPTDDTKRSGSGDINKEPSLEKPESESNVDEQASDLPDKEASTEEPSSNGVADSSEEPADNPKSSGSAKGSKEPSLDRTESELNASVSQSNAVSEESSAKESEGDSSADAIEVQEHDGSVEAAEISLASRLGDDEQKPVATEPSNDEEDDQTGEASEKPSTPPSEEIIDENAPSDAEKSENAVEQIETGEKDSIVDSVEAQESKEEVVEEPCIQKQVSPSTSMLPIKQASIELEEIKKVDLTSLSKDSAEALFYSLKKTELENLGDPAVSMSIVESGEQGDDKDDDADVVVKDEPPLPISRESTKRSFTDDFLESSPITDAGNGQAASDGVSNDNGETEVFNPMMAARARNTQLLHQLHSRDDTSTLEMSPQKKCIRRSMTERMDLSRQDTNFVDLRKYDPDYVEEEDHFDGYYIGSIKHKILASSVSVADSDYFDPEQVDNVIDENNVQTALETIASTDTESTLPSQTTIQANKGFLKRGSQNTSSNIPYASFGNSAINQSLDEFIEREEQLKEAEALAASTIQRSYRRFRTNKRKLLRDYHSTMQTCEEDQSTESLEDYSNSVIQIKLDQKRPEESDNSFEDARMENRRRPMYSLNIDEYDTVTRRMTLTRGVAMQRNSTPEEDSGKSDNASGEKKSTASEPPTNLALAEDSPISSSDLSEDKKSSTSGDEKENKDNSSPKSSGALKDPSDDRKKVVSSALVNGRQHAASMDVQKLFVARQRTMPVQIETSVLRAQPKHTRKRIKSAGMLRK